MEGKFIVNILLLFSKIFKLVHNRIVNQNGATVLRELEVSGSRVSHSIPNSFGRCRIQRSKEEIDCRGSVLSKFS